MNTIQGQQLAKQKAGKANESGLDTVQNGLGLVGGIISMIPNPYTRIIGGVMQGAGTTMGAVRTAGKGDTGGAILSMLTGGSGAMNMAGNIKQAVNTPNSKPINTNNSFGMVNGMPSVNYQPAMAAGGNNNMPNNMLSGGLNSAADKFNQFQSFKFGK